MSVLPSEIVHIGVPPIKCQGIKTKLVSFIFNNVCWNSGESGRWVEPFLGSGVVAFNLAPPRATLSDSNPHLIRFYQGIQNGAIDCVVAREFLTEQGMKLEAGGADYYYEVRRRFNEQGSSLDFLFLNRSCFNGLMRFNRGGDFNVPFGHKPKRFAKAYITKIVNQIGWAAKQMQGKDWQFLVSDWQTTLAKTTPEDFIYLDPPYIGRHTDYYNTWNEEIAIELAQAVHKLKGGYALSMWLENEFRKNIHVTNCWSESELRICQHYYHVGSQETLRHAVDEALLLKPGYAAPHAIVTSPPLRVDRGLQLAMTIE